MGHYSWQSIYFMQTDPDLVDLLDLSPHEHRFGAGASRLGVEAAWSVETDGTPTLVHTVEVALFGNDLSGLA